MNKEKIIYELTLERNRLAVISREAQKRLEKAPEGTVHIIKHGKGVQFYQRKDPADKSGVYIPASERGKAISLIQKKYDRQILAAAKKQKLVLDHFLKHYDFEALKSVYTALSDTRKRYVEPAELPDREYEKIWQQQEYTPKVFLEDMPEHYTSKGERVRSKSEVMIADTLNQEGIPYKYECPLELGGRIIYPDFTILRAGDRNKIYWEHLGMMDDPEYCNNAIQRIRMYESNEIYP